MTSRLKFSDIHLIFLWKLEVVVGFQALKMICKVHDGDWRVAGHTCWSDELKVSGHICKEDITQAQANSKPVDKQHVVITEGEWKSGILLG